MNISNEVLFKAVTAFVDTIADVIAEEVAAKVTARLDRMDKLIEDTRINTAPILEGMDMRLHHLADDLQKVTDRFDHLETASDERVEQIVNQSIESALEDYDPSDHMEISDAIRDELDGAHWFSDIIKDEIRSLTFNVEVS